MKCKYYDDGHGNGSYMSGINCGPPNCNLSKKYITPTCNGNTFKCNIPKTLEKNMTKIRESKSKDYYEGYKDGEQGVSPPKYKSFPGDPNKF